HLKKGDNIVVIGGRTGKDGIHGATFSSVELDDRSEETSSSAVQIGDPITEKKLMDVLIRARDMDLFNSITDCGAGGFSSAVGEMAEGAGAEVYLEKAILKHKNLKAWEIFLSESQERMVLSVPENKLKQLLKMFEEEDVETAVIGRFTDTNRLKVYYEKTLCGDLDLEFLHDGVPGKRFKITYTKPKIKKTKAFKPAKDHTKDLLRLLCTHEISSKEKVIREYDFEVKGATFLKPLQGLRQGPGDGSVIIPDFQDMDKGIAVAHGINVRYGDIDPYQMALSSIDEAIRNYIAIGGSLQGAALLDNFCWGNPEQNDRLGALVKSAQACHDAALNYNLPFISGKDSFYNEFIYKKNKTISIPYTLLISIFGPVKTKNIVSMDLKKEENAVFIIGETKNEMGGSCFHQIHKCSDDNLPMVNLKEAHAVFNRMEEAIDKGLIISAHDISDGGLVTGLAEMALAGNKGFIGTLSNIPTSRDIKHSHEILFSETNSRFLVEVQKDRIKQFHDFFKGIKHGLIGRISYSNEFQIFHDETTVINTKVETLEKYWKRILKK
ncbi:MAG: phosphoribosylformylglycinamidine synthase, partial [Spirochaetes bacterium]|nr:phosphoribosylformylglycinamidine synthase [Spirochaetota bacterium]